MTRLRLAATCMIPALLLSFATGCGASSSSQQGSAADSTDNSLVGTPGQLDQGFSTIVPNNSVTIELDPPSPGGCANGQAQIDVGYTDDANFFSGASSIALWMHVAATSGSSTSTVMDGFVALSLASGTYLNEICVNAAQSYRVELAFADTAHDKWDSNDSKNYALEFTLPTGAPTEFSASFDTVDNNHGEIDIDDTPTSNTNCAGATFNVTYQDKTGFFSGASSINMWMRADTNGVVTRLALARTGNNPTTYSLTNLNTILRCMSPAAATGKIELAFSNSSATKWDSNNSQNYIVTPKPSN